MGGGGVFETFVYLGDDEVLVLDIAFAVEGIFELGLEGRLPLLRQDRVCHFLLGDIGCLLEQLAVAHGGLGPFTFMEVVIIGFLRSGNGSPFGVVTKDFLALNINDSVVGFAQFPLYGSYGVSILYVCHTSKMLNGCLISAKLCGYCPVIVRLLSGYCAVIVRCCQHKSSAKVTFRFCSLPSTIMMGESGI